MRRASQWCAEVEHGSVSGDRRTGAVRAQFVAKRWVRFRAAAPELRGDSLMTVVVILAFAAHVIAWLVLPDDKAVKPAREAVRTSPIMQPSGI
jgi:hypothetical protein